MPLVPEHIETLHPYLPGKPIEETERELGISNILKLASNENALGPSPRAVQAVRDAVAGVHLYPDGSSFYLKRRLAERLDLTPEEIVLGNGSNECIVLLVRAFLRPMGTVAGGDDEAVVSDGSFIMYQLALHAHGVKSVSVPMKDRTFDLTAMADAIGPRTRMVFIANPNNPTGTWVGRVEFEAFLERVPPEVMVILDEAYFEYVDEPDYPSGLELRKKYPNVIVLRTFSKIYGLAGFRCGYSIASPQINAYLDRVRDPFNVNGMAQVAAQAALDDDEHLERTRALNREGLSTFRERLPALGVKLTPSICNFVLADFASSGKDVFDAMLQKGVIIRPMAGYGFPNSARITVGLPAENQRLLAALSEVLAG